MDQILFVVTPSNDLEVSLQEFVVALKQSDYAPDTRRAYEWNLRRLVAWLTDRGLVSPRQVTRVILREWGASLYDATPDKAAWSPATVKQALNAARAWFRWLWEERQIQDNPAEALRLPREKLRVQRTITPVEILRLMAVCDIGTAKGLRDRAIISLLFDSGLRSAELCRLSVKRLHLDDRKFYVRVKGGNEKEGWLGENTADHLRAWLRIRHPRPGVHSVFVAIGGTRPGHGLTRDGLRKILRDLGDAAGVEGVCTHAFRRGFAVKLSEDGVPDNVLKDFGRWESTKQIKRYTQSMQASKLFPRYSPMDNLEPDSD